MRGDTVILQAYPFTKYLVIARWTDGTMSIDPAGTKQQVKDLIQRRKNDLRGLDAKVFAVEVQE